MNWMEGDRVRVIDQPAITGTVARYDCETKLVILDYDRQVSCVEDEEGVLVFHESELEAEPVGEVQA